MSDPFVGEIRIFAGNFAPSGWALCNGQALSLSQNTALFSLLGITYGGNGTTTFNLPNLQGRCVLGFGTSTTGSTYTEGESAGSESVTLNQNNMPAHVHLVDPPVYTGPATQSNPGSAYPAEPSSGSGRDATLTNGSATVSNASGAAYNTGAVGGSVPTTIMQPYLVLNYIIALQGIYPPQS